jgi:hypothetical protein
MPPCDAGAGGPVPGASGSIPAASSSDHPPTADVERRRRVQKSRATIHSGCLSVSSPSVCPNEGRYRPKFNSKSLGTP